MRSQLSSTYQLVLVGEGVLVGTLAGVVITLYRMALSQAEHLMRLATEMAAGSPLKTSAWIVVCAALCLAVALLVRWEPDTAGSGIPQTDAEVMGRLEMRWPRVMAAKFAEGVLCAAGGLSLGREGPSVQLGAVSGKAVASTLGRSRGEERLLATCGAAAGMSAAFNAPLTGVLFALEEIHKEFTPTLILSVMASALAANFVGSQVLGAAPVLELVYYGELPHRFYLYVIALGIVCGVLGALHNRGMFWCQERLFSRIGGRHATLLRLAVAFALAGVAAFVAPRLCCGGDAIAELIDVQLLVPWRTTVALLLGKYVLTALCFASGAPGGTMFPLVTMGMLVGDAVGVLLAAHTGVTSSFIVNFVVLGVAGMFASVVQAPVCAVVLAFELTGSLDALLAVGVVSIMSYATARTLGVDPFYEHLLARLIGTQRRSPSMPGTGGHKVLHTHTVGAGSRGEGQRVCDIAWPTGVRVIVITRAGEELVPTGDTRLLALDELLLIMDDRQEFESQKWATHTFHSRLT